MKTFASDNFASVHPTIMEALQRVNVDHAMAYGADPHTKEAEERIQALFGSETETYFVYNGTGANVVALRCLLNPFEAAICAKTAHINVDECGAPEWMTGSKLITLPTEDGKLTPEQIQTVLHGFGDQHHVQPKVISITQSTEYGTLYSLSELKAIADLAHAHQMYLHVDGARIANAAAALSCTLKELVTDTCVDVLSFGGTKNGLMFGEAVVFLRKELAKNAKFYRKQSAQLCSKNRYIAAQFNALLTDNLWLENARHANRLAQKLLESVKNLPGVTITQTAQVNAVFARIPKEVIPVLQEKNFFWIWNEETGEVRWMTAWDTTEEDVEAFTKLLAETLK